MIYILDKPPTPQQLEKMQEEYPGFIKVVADLEKGIIVGGGEFHIDGEEILVQNGSHRTNLWGGGYNLEGNKVAFGAMTNLKPFQNHATYEIAPPELREQFETLVRRF